MPSPSARAATVYKLAALLALVALAGGGYYGWTVLRDCQAVCSAQAEALVQARTRIAGLAAERDALATELETARSVGTDLSARVAQLQADLDEARSTRLDVREIRGTADFPILRAMARGGDTVAGFAAREQTTEAVVRSLNPWLADDVTTLESWQTLWVPKPPEGG